MALTERLHASYINTHRCPLYTYAQTYFVNTTWYCSGSALKNFSTSCRASSTSWVDLLLLGFLLCGLPKALLVSSCMTAVIWELV